MSLIACFGIFGLILLTVWSYMGFAIDRDVIRPIVTTKDKFLIALLPMGYIILALMDAYNHIEDNNND